MKKNLGKAPNKELLQTAESLCRQAEAFYQNENLSAAEHYWKAALKEDQHCAEAYFGLGRIAYIELLETAPGGVTFSSANKAVTMLMRAIDEGLPGEQVFMTLAGVYEAVNEVESVIGILEAGLIKFPESIDLLILTAKNLNFNLEFESSIPYLLKAIELDPNKPDAWEEISYVRLMRGEFSNAINAAKRVIEIHPRSPRARHYHSVAQSRLALWN